MVILSMHPETMNIVLLCKTIELSRTRILGNYLMVSILARMEQFSGGQSLI